MSFQYDTDLARFFLELPTSVADLPALVDLDVGFNKELGLATVEWICSNLTRLTKLGISAMGLEGGSTCRVNATLAWFVFFFNPLPLIF